MSIRPSSAHPLIKSSTEKVIKWVPTRPITAGPAEGHKKMISAKDIVIEPSIDKSHASLPRDTLGSRLVKTLPRPLSASIKAKPAFKLNTQVFAKAFNPEIYVNQPQPGFYNKQARLGLVNKLKSLCHTRSLKLLEDSVKDLGKEQTRSENDVAFEVKKIWEMTERKREDDGAMSENRGPTRVRPATANIGEGGRVRHVFIPGLDSKLTDSGLPVIPERTARFQALGIQTEEFKYLKKPCDIKLFSLEVNEKPPAAGFRGKVLRRSYKTLKAGLIQP